MNEASLDQNLIERVLTLLKVPENNSAGTDVSAAVSNQAFVTAREIIHFMDEMPGGFLIYHADGNEEIIYANKALLRIFQCSTLEEFKEYTGNSFQGIVHPQDLKDVEKSIWQQVAASHYDLDYVEYRIVRKDGKIRWIEDYGHYIKTASIGNIFYVFLSDSTEKKNRHMMEKAAIINEKERKMKHLIEEYDKERKLINQEHLRRLEVIEGLSVNYESILYADLDENKIFPYRLSSRTSYQFGKKFQTLGLHWYISNYVDTWVHPEDRELLSRLTDPEYIREKLSHNKTYYINYRVLNNGELQYLQLRIVNVGNKKHVSQIVLGYRRVDEEVRREMEQKQILESALNNANLAIVAKNTFLSNMSHDMRTPLNAIFGFTTLAKQHIKDSEAVENCLDKIETASSQLLNLIEKVLEISWTESNDVTILEEECNLNDVLLEVHKSLLPQISEKNISFFLNCQELKHCDVFSDHDKLRQLFLYLTHNAVTYTNPGGTVELTAVELDHLPNDYIAYQFIVKDNGIGIGEDFIDHVFDPFEREKNTTFSGIHGTGLSLTIAKNIVTMMGGSIQVSSAVGEGSTFTVTLRMRIQNHPAPTTDEDTMEDLTGLKILLVEDNMINMKIETEILRGLGFVIEAAANGSIAVDKVASSSPGDFDLILMDIQMPVMDGRQATKAIRRLKNPALASIPIIALSANAFESDRRMSIESGMDAHLTKPMDIPLLLETILRTRNRIGQKLRKQKHTPKGSAKRK